MSAPLVPTRELLRYLQERSPRGEVTVGVILHDDGCLALTTKRGLLGCTCAEVGVELRKVL